MSYAEWKRWHTEYINGPEFAKVRAAVWRRDEGRCRGCSELHIGEQPFDVHHTNYYYVLVDDNPDADFDKEVESCRLLCRRCHRKAHNLPPEEIDEEQQAILREVVG